MTQTIDVISEKQEKNIAISQVVTVVMPAYNEADLIQESVLEWYTEVIEKLPGSELIVVDDCSKDATAQRLRDLMSALPALRIIQPQKNGGHGKALRFGFEHIQTDWVFQTDSDRQHVPSDFWRLWNLREQNDFVFGFRQKRADGPVRVVITNVMRGLNFLLWRLWLRDANCPFKLMRAAALQTILASIPGESFIPMVMVSILARKLRFRVVEVEVAHLPRTGGTQSLQGLKRWLKVGAHCSRELLDLRLTLRK